MQLFISASNSNDAIIIDDVEGAYMATKALIRHGHKNIVLVDGDNEVFLKRKEGLMKAFSESKIKFDEKCNTCALEPNIDVISTVRNHVYKYRNTAIIAVTEIIAQQVCLALQQIGKNIPDDVSLVVYDDSPWAQLSDFSAIGHPIPDLINNIVNKLLNKDKDTQHETITLPPIFLNRGSIKEV